MDLSQDVLLPILLATVVANAAIVVILLASGRIGRKGVATASHPSAFGDTIMSSSYDRSAAASSWPPTVGPADTDDLEVDTETPPVALLVPRSAPTDDLSTELSMPATPAPHPDDAIDPLTGLPDASAFSRLVTDEDARIARYHRSATVVVFELEGLDRLVERLGDGAADRVVPAVADTLRRLARSADHVARLGPGRFGALLPETDEVAAINYIERVRKACDLWLESGAIAMRLAIGWAGTAGDPPLADAQRTATDRMYAELRRGARRTIISDDDAPTEPPAPPTVPPAAS